MSPEEIAQAYEVLAQEVKDKNAVEAARIGNAQRSLGALAAEVASPSGQTSGLANYTYNRMLRPTVDTLATSLVTSGKASALEAELKNRLRAAKNAYEDARNAYTVASTTPKAANKNPYSEKTDNEYTGERVDESTGDKNANPVTGPSTLTPVESAAANLNAYAALTGGGQLKVPSRGTKFSYTLNGSTHTGYVYDGEGGSIDGMDFTKSGLKNYLDKVVKQGASFQNYLGNDTDYSLWKIAFHLY